MNPSYSSGRTPPQAASTPVTAVRVWDLPTRVFHWLLLVCVIGLFASAYAPGHRIELHARFGYAVLTLLLFRLVWGFVGGHWSRFIHFIPRGGAGARLGHSLSGALAVLAMLLALAAQVATGLVGDDEIAFIGPLNRFVTTDLGLAATAWHKGVGQWILVGLIALHVGAIAFYRLARHNDLIGPMLGGDKVVDPAAAPGVPVAASADTTSTRLLALAVLALCASAVGLMVRMA
ncbi:MAG: hypothetical protein RL513_32 [Pseudomonadota bacterium]